MYDDLLGKSSKGLEFYKKLQGNIQKLLARVKGAKDVQDEERQQRLKSTKPEVSVPSSVPSSSAGPKLKDYLNNKNQTNKGNTLPDPYVPSVRSSMTADNSTLSTIGNTVVNNPNSYPVNYPQANDPPPPYVPYGTYNNMYNQYPTLDSGQATYNQPSPYNAGKTVVESTYEQVGSANVPQALYAPNTHTPAPNQIYDQSSQHLQGFQANNNDSTVYQFVGSSTQQQQPTQNNQMNYPYQGFIQPPSYSVLDTAKYQPSVSPSPSQTSSTGSGWVAQQPYLQNTQQIDQTFQLPQSNQTPSYLQNVHQSPMQQYQEPTQNYQQQLPQQQFQQPQSQTPLQQPQMQEQQQFQQPQQIQSHAMQPNQQFSGGSNAIYSNSNSYEPEKLNSTITPSNSNTYTDLYTTTSQSNYQITANNQYVTGYDQSGKIYSNQNATSYGGHPGYTFNQNSGIYSYGSGYQVSQKRKKNSNRKV